SFSEITTIAESPLDAKVLWVGTDDGNVQVSTDGGKSWKEVSAAIVPVGVKSGTYVARIVASSASKGAAIVAFDAHRSGDFAPYIVRTTDFGKSWIATQNGLASDASVRSIQEYPGKPSVLFAGTERHLYVSTDTGAHWTRIAGNLPTTRYDDIVIHPRTHDLVLATHGRSIWILDDASPIAEWSGDIAARRSYFFAPARATLMQYWEDISNTAQGMYAGENPADGTELTYYLSKPASKVRLIVRGQDGRVVREIAGATSGGVIHRVTWDLRHEPPPATAAAGAFGGEEGGGPTPAPGGRAGAPAPVQLPIPTHDIGNRGPYVSPGKFMVTLDVDGETSTQSLEVRSDPALTIPVAQQRAREAFLLDVQAVQVELEQRASELRAMRAEAAGADSAALQALERRLTAGRESPRAKLGGIARAFNGTGAQQGSFAAPTELHRQMLSEVKAELAAVEDAMKKRRP
ncbi:MAG TPA: hypothetical protein VL524_08490, partial [Gemmatimonadaceae bacterium]|nr:hypothetical protein [Gemmatimonadaceae bacterium]